MRAVLIRDSQVTVGVAADPTPAADDVVVEIAAAGLNAADLQQLRGRYSAPPEWPQHTPGLELAGTIRQLGTRVGAAPDGSSAWKVGDRVMALVGGGAHAELLAVPASLLIRIPDSVDFVAAAGFPEAYSTAWDALIGQGQLKAGERVLVTGAAGGVGSAAIQIATLSGARVVASVRRHGLEAQLEAVAPGVSVVQAGDEGDHGPFDVVLELVGGPELANRVDQLNIGGRIVVIGVGAGARASLSLHSLMVVRGRISASTLRSRPTWEKAVLAQQIDHTLVPAFAHGTLSVPIDAAFGLSDAADAYDRMGASGKFGKVVLDMRES
jgi:NADPH:quinone reductase